MKLGYVGILTLSLASSLAVGGTGCAHHSSNGARAENAAKHEHHELTPEQRRRAAHEKAEREQVAALERDQPPKADAFNTEPNNTRVNERDRESSVLTPMDQSEEASDRELTATIRKAMIGDSSLSFTAKNTKIITRDGLVTLRGTVVNAREKETIEKIALQSAGKGRVIDELEIER